LNLSLTGFPLLFIATVFGMVIGSFLNVVIHRLPAWLQHQWRAQAAELLDKPPETPSPPNLAYPASHCPLCLRPLLWWHNIPLISFLILRGRCHFCHAPIRWRYPIVELVCGLWFAWCAHHNANDLPQAMFWALWGAALLASALIDLETFLLPDALTQPLLWASLVAAALGVTPLAPIDALWGAVLGYAVLAIPAWLFERLTGKVGMAPGDFKLLAAVGAALGWPQVIPVLLLSCGLGIALALGMRWLTPSAKRQGSETGAIPFGPAIATAALCTQIWPHWPLALQLFG
jgi:leader peptidase (prepilin peptidase) / N-methyltransferase